MTPLILSALLLAPAAPAEHLLSRIVAVVNEDVVLLDEVEEAAGPLLERIPGDVSTDDKLERSRRLRRQVLETLIADKLLEQQVEVLKIEASERELDGVIEDLQKQNSLTPEQFELALRGQGLTLREYRDGLRKQLLKMKIINVKVRSKVQVSDQDVKNLYQRQRAAADRDLSYRVRHILFLAPETATDDEAAAARARAVSARKRLLAGEDFAAVARAVSEAPDAPQGGDLGFFRPGDMVESFEKAALALEVGQVSAPVRTPFGWHLIKLEERRTGKVADLKEVERQLRERLMQEEVEVAFGRYIDELKKSAHIERRLDPSFADDDGASAKGP
ncbi:MAG: peptidylprolyl isomerase [Pseudomonadota bacterium]